jgi:cytochrome c oxidase cbb3-type subunit 3/ubiquinol-cytochrome c reductase cytochrome c subunit
VRIHSFFLVLLIAFAAVACNQREQTLVERRGARVYQKMCAVCHGPSGAGYKADRAPGIMRPMFLGAVTDEFLRTAIVNGRTGTTMSAWGVGHGGPLGPSDVNAVIAYMRSWDRQAHRPLDESLVRGDATRGQETYTRECMRCHGTRGTGGLYVNIANPQLLATASDGFLRHAIREGRPGTAMLSLGPTLGDGAVEDLVALLRSWQIPVAPTELASARKEPLPLGPVPLNPRGPEPIGFRTHPLTTPADVVKAQLDRHARLALLDARAPSDYTNEHIAGAVSVPFYDVEPYVTALPKDTWLVCYCSCPHAESQNLANALVAKGFRKVTVLDEGIGVWRSKKYGTTTGEKP